MKLLLEAIERAGRVPGEEIALALDPATSELWDDGAYVLAGEGRTLELGGVGRLLGGPGGPLPDRVHRGRHGRGGLGRLGRAAPRRWGAGSSWSATTSSSPTRRSWSGASARAWPTPSWSSSTRSGP